MKTPYNYYFNYNITYMCNQNCAYCYAMKEYSDIWNKKSVDIRQIENEIELFSALKFECAFEILGGEPLMHRHIRQILESMYKKLYTIGHHINISTNATARQIEKLNLNLKVIQSITWLLSWHGNYSDFDKFKRNVEYLLINGATVQINIMPNNPGEDILSLVKNLEKKFSDTFNWVKLKVFDADDGIQDFAGENRPQFQEICRYEYKELFLDSGYITGAGCVLNQPENFRIPFNKEFIQNLKPFEVKKCPIPGGCNVPNAEYCGFGD